MSIFKDYDAWCKTIGKFDIYTGEYNQEDLQDNVTWNASEDDFEYDQDLMVKLSFTEDNDVNRRMAYAALTNIAHQHKKQMEDFDEGGCDPDKHEIESRIVFQYRKNHPILGAPLAEYGAIFYARPSVLFKLIEAEDATFQALTVTGELLPDFSKMRVSLTCAYKEEGGSKHVRVRFGGYSVNYYFNSVKFHREKTLKEIKSSYSIGKTKLIMSVLDRPEIFERANSKVINESGIGESSPIALHLLVPTKQGWKIVGENNKTINNPDTKPAFLLCENGSYGRNYLVDSDNVIYTVTSFRLKREGYSGEFFDEENFWHGEKNVQILKTAIETTDIDDYTKKRIERAIKRKL